MKKVTALKHDMYPNGTPSIYLTALLECGHLRSTTNINLKRAKCHTCESKKPEDK